MKKDDMLHEYQVRYPQVANKKKFYVGDVRDLQSLRKTMPFGVLAIICFLCTVITFWSYGNSYVSYVAVSVVMAIFAYSRFFSSKNQVSRTFKWIITLLLIATLFLGFQNGDIKSSIMVNISLLMPIALSTINISYDKIQKQIILASIVNLVIIILMGADFTNSNSLAFMIYGGISVGMIWFKLSTGIKSKLFSTAYLVLATVILLAAGSRNAGIIIIINYVMLLIPSRIYADASLFRTLYCTVLLLTVFSVDFQMYILQNDQIMDYLLSYTTSFSNKPYGLDTHYLLLQSASIKFSNLDLFTQLFGMGIKTGHCHNIFYQCLYFYGYVGTILIYIFYIYVFEKAYSLIKLTNDVLVLCCVIILIGHFLLQISEVYMLGTEAANMMSLFPTAVILQRWYTYRGY